MSYSLAMGRVVGYEPSTPSDWLPPGSPEPAQPGWPSDTGPTIPSDPVVTPGPAADAPESDYPDDYPDEPTPPGGGYRPRPYPAAPATQQAGMGMGGWALVVAVGGAAAYFLFTEVL